MHCRDMSWMSNGIEDFSACYMLKTSYSIKKLSTKWKFKLPRQLLHISANDFEVFSVRQIQNAHISFRYFYIYVFANR